MGLAHTPKYEYVQICGSYNYIERLRYELVYARSMVILPLAVHLTCVPIVVVLVCKMELASDSMVDSVDQVVHVDCGRTLCSG